MKIKEFLCLLLLVSAVSCVHTNKWYVDAAVQRARNFVLESESPRLTTVQQGFIRFAAPAVLTTPAMDGMPYGVNQTCITWVIPDYSHAIMVCGYGDDNFSNWTPNRILLRDLTIPNPALDNAVAAARDRILVDLYNTMTPEQYNCVRFSQPLVYKTAFDLMQNIPGGEEVPADESGMQYSIVWKFDDGGGCAVACGTACVESIEGWNFKFCACMDNDEFEAARAGAEGN